MAKQIDVFDKLADLVHIFVDKYENLKKVMHELHQLTVTFHKLFDTCENLNSVVDTLDQLTHHANRQS